MGNRCISFNSNRDKFPHCTAVSAAEDNTCTECESGYIIFENRCVFKCNDGKDGCETCSENSTTCLKCKKEYGLKDGKCYECFKNEGSLPFKQCKKCSQTENHTCLKCNEERGFKLNDEGKCKDFCEEGKRNCKKCNAEKTTCEECNPEKGIIPAWDICLGGCSGDNKAKNHCKTCISWAPELCEECEDGYAIDTFKTCHNCSEGDNCKCGKNCLKCGGKQCFICKGSKKPNGPNCDGEEEVEGAYSVTHRGRAVYCDLSQGYVKKDIICQKLDGDKKDAPAETKCLYAESDDENKITCLVCKGEFKPKGA